ncbi:DUF6538 domain-containing protein [Cupriavidus oxalaticus]
MPRRCYTGTCENPNGNEHPASRHRLRLPPQIPLDLIEQHSGTREIIRSLGTKNRAEAERLADEYAEKVVEEEADRLSVLSHRRAPQSGGRARPHPTAIRAAAEPLRAAGQSAKAIKPAISSQTLESIIPLWQRDKQPTARTVDAVIP